MFSPFRDIFANCEFPLRPLPPSGVAMTCRAAVGVAAKSWFNQAHATEPPPQQRHHHHHHERHQQQGVFYSVCVHLSLAIWNWFLGKVSKKKSGKDLKVEIWWRHEGWGLVMFLKLDFCSDLKWSLVELLRLNIGRDFEARFGQIL